MKLNRTFIILMASLPLSVTGCLKEYEHTDVLSSEETIELSVSLPDKGITKTYLGDRIENTFPLLWAEGDKVSMNGTTSTPVRAEDAGKRSSTFSFRGSVNAPFNILYPATAEADKVVFPDVQNYRQDSFDPSAFPMYASSDGHEDAVMHHLGTLLGFPFAAPSGEAASLKQLIIMSIDGHALAGTFSLQKDEKEAFTGAMTPVEGVTTATLQFPEDGLALGNEPVTAWIALPSGEYPKGFIALAVDTHDRAMMLNFMTKEDSEDNLQAGTAILFPTVTLNPGEGIFIIDEPEDLIKLSSEPTEHPEVLMVKDIDMSEVESWTPVEGFNGLFNGAGHTVSGLNDAVFGTLDGNVKNLVVDADITKRDLYISALANVISTAGKVESCSVKGKMSISGTQTASVYMGGIAAVNNGEITTSNVSAMMRVPADASSGPLYMGGVTGYSTGKLSSLTSCCTIDCAGTIGNSFCGQIAGYQKSGEKIGLSDIETEEGSSIRLTYPSAGTPYLRFGGLFGYINSPQTCIDECTSRTDMEIIVPEGVTKSKMLLGGIAGNVSYTGEGSAEFSSCTNYGNIIMTGYGKIGENSAIDRPSCMAGIVAKCEVETGVSQNTKIVLQDCINNGDIHMNSLDATLYSHITYIAGLCADINAADIQDLRCVNNGNMSITGYTDRSCMAGHIGVLWPSVGTESSLTIIGKSGEPANTGSISYYDRENQDCLRHPVAAGIIGLLMGSSVPVKFNISNCMNSGTIDRRTPTSSKFVKQASSEASAGGIVGNIGFQSSTEGYTAVTGVIENCSNSAQITINAFTREDATFHDHHIENTASQSFLGGIVGFSHAKNGEGVTIRNCSNSGYMRLTAGNAGGIVGRIQSNTTVTGTNAPGNVTYTTNTGRVGEFGLDIPATYISTGYVYSGGIVGAMVYTDPSDPSKIEYCHNAGDISGSHVLNESTGKGTGRPTAGGIIGQYDCGRSYAAVRWCKNSGHVRCYRSYNGGSTYFYSGLISGSALSNRIADPEAPEEKFARISDCAVGGLCLRNSGWTAPTSIDGEYPFYNYIYCYQDNWNIDYPPTTEDGTGYAEGCEVWDGISKTSWEE